MDTAFPFDLLNKVFDDFLQTNKMKLTVANLLLFDRECVLTFQQSQVPYLATISLYSKNGLEWVNLKLNYKYAFAHFLSRSDKWIRTDQKRFTFICGFFKDTHDVVILYNLYLNRVNIKFHSKDGRYKNVAVTFEPGFADEDEDVEYDAIE